MGSNIREYLLPIILLALLVTFSFILHIDKASGIVRLEGVLTRNFTDCASSFSLAEKGEVVEDDGITCDGGSFIILDRSKVIRTDSGFTSVDEYWNKHDPSWRPGTKLAVKAMELELPAGSILDEGLSAGTSYYDISCSGCGVQIK